MNEFELLYHSFMHGIHWKKYENEIEHITLNHHDMIRFILKPFIKHVPELNIWYSYLFRIKRNETNRERKERRIIIRRLVRLSFVHPRVQRVLDLILERMREDTYETDENYVF